MLNIFKDELFELLTIEARSGEEAKVVTYLLPKLAKLVDRCFLDDAGNLLGELVVGTGEGCTIVLSAHMDTVSNIGKNREVLYNPVTNTFSSSEGILGADDRAGIAIILSVLRNLKRTGFNGKLKIAFCCSEEVGCVGSEDIDKAWYQDAALAIVVDRRGNRDIVTGCGSPLNFCSKEVADFFENVGAMIDQEWKAVGGGLSDAATFSSKGVNSVNLSAGYYNEHTSNEYVNIMECKDTIQFVLQSLSVVNTFASTFGEVPKGWRSNYSTSDDWWRNYNYSYKRDQEAQLTSLRNKYDEGEVTFYVNRLEDYGDLECSKFLTNIYINQLPNDKKSLSEQEIIMDERSFKNIIDQYCRISGYKPKCVKANRKNVANKSKPIAKQNEVKLLK
jgi:hypothetical protein